MEKYINNNVFYGNSWEALLRRELYKKSIQLLLKPKRKKIITWEGFITQLNLGWRQKEKLIVFYYQPMFEQFIKLLKQEGIIFDYRISPSQDIIGSLTLQSSKYCQNILIVYLQEQSMTNYNVIKILSLPSRPLNCMFHTVLALANKKLSKTTIHVLNTSQGLVTLTEAVNKKLSGVLLCRIN